MREMKKMEKEIERTMESYKRWLSAIFFFREKTVYGI